MSEALLLIITKLRLGSPLSSHDHVNKTSKRLDFGVSGSASMIPGRPNKRSNYHASSGQSEYCQADNNELRTLIYQVAGFPTEQ